MDMLTRCHPAKPRLVPRHAKFEDWPTKRPEPRASGTGKLPNVRLFGYRLRVNCRTYGNKYPFLSICEKPIVDFSRERCLDKVRVNQMFGKIRALLLLTLLFFDQRYKHGALRFQSHRSWCELAAFYSRLLFRMQREIASNNCDGLRVPPKAPTALSTRDTSSRAVDL